MKGRSMPPVITAISLARREHNGTSHRGGDLIAGESQRQRSLVWIDMRRQWVMAGLMETISMGICSVNRVYLPLLLFTAETCLNLISEDSCLLKTEEQL